MKPGDVVADRFEIERVAGAGGMGTVYRARDRASSGDPVALKVLTAAQNADRFAREARVLADLRHPGIVRYVSDGRTNDGQPFLAMEWLDGEDLAQRLAHAGLTAAESVALAIRVAEALGAAHARGIIHRDVKPSNLFLLHGDLARVKVLDFGIARLEHAPRQATATGLLVGTPGYMAPEQARGAKDLDGRVDVFALGCVLFECLTGRSTFVGEHVMALLAKILLEDAPRVSELRPDVPEDLDRLVGRMLAKERELRPRDGAAVAKELASLGNIAATAASPPRAASASLTATEQRLLCVVLAGDVASATIDGEKTMASLPTLAPPSPLGSRSANEATFGAVEMATLAPLGGEQVNGPTLDGGAATDALVRLQAAVAPFGARLEQLMNGAAVVALSGAGGATDQAAQAARCALAMRAIIPNAPLALATGRGVLAGRWPVGDAIDRAARLLRMAAPIEMRGSLHGSPPVRLDDVTAGLLDVRFDIGGDRAGLFLRGERDVVDAGRTLLGKATACVGRERELGVLAGLLEQCCSEPMARAVVVTGPAGVGKSRLRYEFLKKVKTIDAAIEIWIVRGDPISAGSPFGMIAPALRRAAAILEGEPLEVRQRKLRARVARHVAASELQRVTEFLGELIGAPFSDQASVELRAARADALLMGDQMRRAFEDLLDGETRAGPLLFVLEDLHWGDLPSVKFIDWALRNLPDRPLMVLALARPEVRELFPGLWAERAVEEIRLGELTRRGSEKLVRGVLGDEVSAEVVTRLVERAGGNAFYLEELIRAVAEGKGDAMPETLLAVVQARLERLEGDARRLLRAASVFGQVFWKNGVRALLGRDDRTDVLHSWLVELEEREVITRRGDAKFKGEEEFTVRHAMVREAAYAMLTDADRRLGHQLAGEWLERAGETEAVVLAEHFERGGDGQRAAGWYRRAAEQALGGNDFQAVIVRAERGITSGATGEARGALRLLQAEAHKWSGEFTEAEKCGLEAMRDLGRGSPLWFGAAGEVAEASGKIGHHARLVEIGEELVANTVGGGAGGPQVVASASAAFQLFYAGHIALAESLFERIEKAESEVRERDPGILARIHQARSSRAMLAGDVGLYLEEEQAASAAFEKAGDLRNCCVQRGYVGYACLGLGLYDEAERALREALQSAQRMGLSNVMATAKHNLGYVLALSGAIDEGLRVEHEALAMVRAQGDRRLQCGAHEYLARILLLHGDVTAAEREAEAAMELSTGALRPGVHALLASILLIDGRVEEALGEARDAMEEFQKLGVVEEGEAMIRIVYAEALLASGLRDEARTAVFAGRDRLLAQAEPITDPRHRKAFLERVPENVRTFALARSLS